MGQSEYTTAHDGKNPIPHLGRGEIADNRRAAPAERGVSEMMVNLYTTFAKPLSDGMLFEWHRMLMGGRQDLADVGRYCTSAELMQIVSGARGAAQIHFEAPPSARFRQR